MWGVGRLQYIKEYTVGDPIGRVTTLKTLWHIKHTKDFISNVLHIGYMYACTHRKIYHVYILEHILGDMEKQHHQGLKVSLLHSLHASRYTVATRSSTTQVCYIKIWRCCTSLHSKFSVDTLNFQSDASFPIIVRLSSGWAHYNHASVYVSMCLFLCLYVY